MALVMALISVYKDVTNLYNNAQLMISCFEEWGLHIHGDSFLPFSVLSHINWTTILYGRILVGYTVPCGPTLCCRLNLHLLD